MFKTREEQQEVRLTLWWPTIMWVQIAIHYMWQLVICNSQKNRLDLDINKDKMPTSIQRAAHAVSGSKRTVITVQIIILLACHFRESTVGQEISDFPQSILQVKIEFIIVS